MVEPAIYDKNGITLTSTLLKVADQRYLIRDINSITILKATPPRTGPTVCIVVGFLGLIVYGLGAIGIIGGVCWLLAQSSQYLLILNTSEETPPAGCIEAYRSKDINQVREIQLALNKAIEQQP